MSSRCKLVDSFGPAVDAEIHGVPSVGSTVTLKVQPSRIAVGGEWTLRNGKSWRLRISSVSSDGEMVTAEVISSL